MSITGADKRAREKCISILRRKFAEISKNILEGKRPVIIMPKRVLTNTIYDIKNKLLLLGPEMQRRSFLDVNESKKFMQTLLMASIIYEALINNEYPTIRDLYYRGKHTITYRDLHNRLYHENTWDEQRESDSVIRDLEVYLGLLREELLILSKEKGKVVGNLVIKSGDDIIDLSKMGHGAYSIEPTPDLIEFKDVDAEYVLVVEKDAVFQQLHRYGFWKKYKTILITSAGQPDRATRRFVRRLNEELKLPVYILTDSITADEVVVIKDLRTNEILIGPIEKLLKKYFSENKEKERVIAPLAVLSWDPVNKEIKWYPIGYIYRHFIRDKILKIKLKKRGIVKVTKSHSLFIIRDNRVVVESAYKIKPGDKIIIARKIPLFGKYREYLTINISKLLYVKFSKSKHVLDNILIINLNGEEKPITKTRDTDYDKIVYLKEKSSSNKIFNSVIVDEKLAWLFGIYSVKGRITENNNIILKLEHYDKNVINKVINILNEKFGIKPVIKYNDGVEILISSYILYLLFKLLGIIEKEKHEIINIIINSPKTVALSYVEGVLEGSRNNDHESLEVIIQTNNPAFSKQLFLILYSLGYTDTRVYPNNISLVVSRASIEKTIIHKNIVKEYSNGSTILLQKTWNADKDSLDDVELTNENSIESDTVLSVEEEFYEGYVYDFAVPYTNSFIGGYGIIYHNSDPYGWYIYSVFKIGSITLSYESERLATPNAKFVGVAMTDVFGDAPIWNILKKMKKTSENKIKEVLKLPQKKPYLTESERKNYIIKAKPKDVERAVELIGYDIADICIEDRNMKNIIKRKKEGITGYPWFKSPEWIRELCIFFNTLSKLEIEAMASKGLKFLADKYIPEKIETGDYID